MAKYQIWNKTDNICTPSGKMYTAEEWARKFQWTNISGAKMIITTGIINGGVALEFETTKAQYKKIGANITDDMTDEQVLAAIEEYEDTPVESTPSIEERTAAALEYIAMSSLPDTETV